PSGPRRSPAAPAAPAILPAPVRLRRGPCPALSRDGKWLPLARGSQFHPPTLAPFPPHGIDPTVRRLPGDNPGCGSPASRSGTRGIGGRVTPAARAFASGTRRVVRFAGQAADDAALAARVKAALAIHKGLEGCAIHVGSEDSVICLMGTASNRGQKQLAAEV